MFFFKLTALYLILYSILFLAGWGVCDYACAGKNEKHKFLWAPLIGIVPFASLPYYLSYLGVGAFTGGWATLGIFGSFSLYRLATNPPEFKINNSPLLLLFVFIGIAPSFFIILKAGFFTSILASYASLVTFPADHFVHGSVNEMVPLDFDKPVTSMLFELLKYHSIHGYYFFIASIRGILNVPAYKFYLALSGLIGSFISITVYISCKEGFNLKDNLALIISFLVSINVSYFYWPVIAQFPFITGMVFLYPLLAFIPSMLHCKKRKDYLFYSLLLAGMMSTYAILIPYLMGPVLFYILIQSIPIRRNLPFLKSAGQNIAKILSGTFLLIPFIFIQFALCGSQATSVAAKVPKNIPRAAFLEEFLGFGAHFTMSKNGSFSYYFTASLALIGFFFILAGVYERLKNKDVLFLSVLGFIFCFGCYFYIIDLPYHFYKNAVVGVFVLVTALALGGSFLYEKKSTKFVKLSVAVLFIVYAALNIKTYMGILLRNDIVISQSMMDLENMKNIVPGDKRILIDSQTPTEEAWISYFLQNNKIRLKGILEPWGWWILGPFTGKPNANFFFDYTKDEIDYTLSSNTTDIVKANLGEIVYKNNEFILSKNFPGLYLHSGWHGLERMEQFLFRWTKKESVFLFSSPESDSRMHIKGIVPEVYQEPLEISFFINEKLIEKFSTGPGNFEKQYILDMPLQKKRPNSFAIVLSDTFCPDKLWRSGDSRDLGIMVNSIEITPLVKIPATIKTQF